MSLPAGERKTVGSPGLHATEAPPIGLRFSERMTGRVRWVDGREPSEQSLMLTPTVTFDDLGRMLADPAHRGRFAGTAKLGCTELRIANGHFNLLPVAPERVELRTMRYVGRLVSPSGDAHTFVGVKEIRNHPGFHLWPDTTTLYLALYRGRWARADAVAGYGILRIAPADFLRQLATFRVTNAPTFAQRFDALTDFARFFGGVLFDTCGRLVARARPVVSDLPRRRPRPTPAERGKPVWIPTGDGRHVRLVRQRPQGATKGPVILSPGFGMSSLCYTLDTIETNLCDFLCREGYDVWLFDYRASPDLPAAGTDFTIDDIALWDYPAAVQFVLDQSRPSDGQVQMVVHCVGSMSLLMSLLAGQLAGQVRSLVCSQLGLHPIAGRLNEIKAGLGLAGLLYALGMRRADADYHEGQWDDWAVDKVLRLYPSMERCNNPACRRIFYIFGESYLHSQLNAPTHDAIRDMFGTTSLHALRHLALMLRRKEVVDRYGDDVYFGRLDRLRLPILFLHGEKNQEFLPDATLETVNLLSRTNGRNPETGKEWYKRTVIPRYGHLDCFIGRDAARDVFPLIRDHLNENPPKDPAASRRPGESRPAPR